MKNTVLLCAIFFIAAGFVQYSAAQTVRVGAFGALNIGGASIDGLLANEHEAVSHAPAVGAVVGIRLDEHWEIQAEAQYARRGARLLYHELLVETARFDYLTFPVSIVLSARRGILRPFLGGGFSVSFPLNGTITGEIYNGYNIQYVLPVMKTPVFDAHVTSGLEICLNDRVSLSFSLRYLHSLTNVFTTPPSAERGSWKQRDLQLAAGALFAL
jgi:hypothetical protein